MIGTVVITTILYLYNSNTASYLANVRAQSQDFTRQNAVHSASQNDNTKLEEELTGLRSQVDRQSKALEYMALIDQVGSNDWQIEQLFIQNDHIRITLNTSSGSELLERLASSPNFKEAKLVGDITATDGSGKRLDHLTVELIPAQ
jgi:hypothetical protein